MSTIKLSLPSYEDEGYIDFSVPALSFSTVDDILTWFKFEKSLIPMPYKEVMNSFYEHKEALNRYIYLYNNRGNNDAEIIYPEK